MANKQPRKVGWGKPDIYVKDLEATDGKWSKIPTPMDGTTQLTPTKGDKKEAKLEGGDNEDVMYLANNYALAYQIRRTSNKEMPIKHTDGVVEHHYGVVVVPQNKTAPGCYIAESAVSVEDAFDTTEGGTDLYTHDAVVPSDDSKKVKWGTFEVTEGTDGAITIKGKGGDFGETGVEL